MKHSRCIFADISINELGGEDRLTGIASASAEVAVIGHRRNQTSSASAESSVDQVDRVLVRKAAVSDWGGLRSVLRRNWQTPSGNIRQRRTVSCDIALFMYRDYLRAPTLTGQVHRPVHPISQARPSGYLYVPIIQTVEQLQQQPNLWQASQYEQ